VQAVSEDPAIEVASVRWERVQLIVEARTAPGITIDPSRLALIPDGGGEAMPPTRATATDGRLTIRFNVLVGPGLKPLAPGRWTLGTPVFAASLAANGMPAPGTFTLEQGSERVTPGIDLATRRLTVDVAFDENVRARRRREPLSVRFRRAFFRWLVAASRVVSRRGRHRVLFASRLISEMSGNLKVVHDRMVERGLDRDHELVVMLKPGLTERWRFLDRFRLARALAGADVIVLDDSFPPLNWVDLDPKVRIIQLWHASGAFKTVGYSRVGLPDPNVRVHKSYTAAIVSSEFDVPFYAEAFGIPEERVIPTGIPRMDRFFDERARAEGLAAARAAFPQIEGRMTILFAPTYRGDTIREASYDFDKIDYAALHALCVERDAVVIIKMHPFVLEPVRIPEAFRDRLIDGSADAVDVNDLLFAVDLLITDYSSIVFEYSTLRRPMLFFAYDLDDYVATRDFYVPFESFVPGRIVRTFPELLDAIRTDDYEASKVDDFAARHFAHLDAGSADRVIDQLILAQGSPAR
jgi:CDP-ribitol ribitolphosphotransferase / teichoic acid ribitol-phosphate polymerase